MPIKKPSAARGLRSTKRSSAAPARKAASNKSGNRKLETGNSTAPKRVAEILKRLEATYGGATCALHHKNAWELLVATILSAQCTDVRVNLTTPELFRLYPDAAHLATAKPEEIEPIIKSTGFFRNKSKSIVGAAKAVTETFGGRVPDDMGQLLSLPGVARKTANVVLGTWFKKNEGVVVDTHVYRISRRLELTKADNPKDIEQDLMRVIPREKWTDFSHQVIWHGRALCVARKPKCAECPLENICHAADKTWSTVDIHKARNHDLGGTAALGCAASPLSPRFGSIRLSNPTSTWCPAKTGHIPRPRQYFGSSTSLHGVPPTQAPRRSRLAIDNSAPETSPLRRHLS